MSDDEIEELVKSVIDDMIASGKLMAGEEAEDEDMDMDDMDMGGEEEIEGEEETEEIDEDINLEELLAEIDSEKETASYSNNTAESMAKEMEETIAELRNELNEVNLLNAKLLYTNKIFKAKNLTESEKIKVLNTFDKAETVKEVKLVFETLTESFKTTTVKKNPIKESLGSASRTIAPATPKQPIIEVNSAFARMQQLAGLKK
jgi:hypothetical protein